MIVAEDKRFLKHKGIDIIGILRALFSIVFLGKLQGASTIEQQLVRTITKRYELTIRRKIREIILSIMISSVFPKIKIAKQYLSVAYFGWQMNGINEASRRLNINLDNASQEQSSNIIARLKYPEAEIVSQNRRQQIIQRQKYLLKLLESNKWHLTL